MGRTLERVGAVVLLCAENVDGHIDSVELVNLGPGEALCTEAVVTVRRTKHTDSPLAEETPFTLPAVPQLVQGGRHTLIDSSWLETLRARLGLVYLPGQSHDEADLEITLDIEASSEGGRLEKRLRIGFVGDGAVLTEPRKRKPPSPY